MTTPTSAKDKLEGLQEAIGAAIRQSEGLRATIPTRYLVMWEDTTKEVIAALESDGQVGKFNALRIAIEEMKYPRPLMVDEYAQNNLLDIVLKKLDAAASEGS
jgi:hypothetical protein